MRKTPIILLSVAAAASVTALTVYATTGSSATSTGDRGVTSVPSGAGPPRPDEATEWNAALLEIVPATSTPGPIHPTRNFAVLAVAIDNAVNAVDHTHKPGQGQPDAPRGASARAAAAAAGHDTLVALYPDHHAALDSRLTGDLAMLPQNDSTRQGVSVGRAAARTVLDSRAHDGASATPPPYTTTGAPGDFRPTPPTSSAPVFTGWGAIPPFVLRHGDQFRAPKPPALTSEEYATSLKEVQRLGAKTSTNRTGAQTEDAAFWAAPIQNYWNAIAEQVVNARHVDLDTSSRLFAQLDLALADATIALYDAKYTYRLWRPITAIREAGSTGNPGTTPDQAWEPLATTPADPSYPGAHSDLSFAAAAVLAGFFGDSEHFTVSAPTLKGVVHTFDRFSDAATEAGLSRIYAGVHTRTDHEAGRQLGMDVATGVLSDVPLH
jgi:hypothetical protein